MGSDPAHDAPGDLAAYLARFRGGGPGPGPGWQATAPGHGRRAATPHGGVGDHRVIPDHRGGYTHNAAIHLVESEGGVVDILTWAIWNRSGGSCPPEA